MKEMIIMTSIQDVAACFIFLSKDNGSKYITPTKIQKLLYYAQGYHFKFQGEFLFPEEMIAISNGPFNIDIHNKYKKFKFLSIQDEVSSSMLSSIKKEELKTIEYVFSKLGHLDGKTLEELVNQEDPLLNTNLNDVITKDLIRNYFLKSVL